MTEIMKLYAEMQKKYGLPAFEETDDIFEISDIEELNFLLRNIRRKIQDRLEFFMTFLEELIQPEASFYVLHEYRNLAESDKQGIMALFRKTMQLSREALMISFEEDDNETARFIRDTVAMWPSFTKELKALTMKLRQAWEKEAADVKEHVEYFG